MTLLDVVTAIEGPDEAFRCEEILRQGPGEHEGIDYRRRCFVSQAMRRAEMAWRKELAGQTLADLRGTVERHRPATPGETRAWLANLRT
ncbi:Rrf2 family transcriptional regulator [Actinomadura madurae]|uniref:Rrf2 family transcriptional regulator n=1 Tax=Actinomadura madurae TaxID=1993 RepID=UPI0032B08052